MKMLTKIHQQNVNGIPLTLTIEPKSECPKSRIFTIFFKKKENKSSFSKFSLFLAVIFNILSIFYIRISLNAILITVIVLSFLLVLWITHSVQSGELVHFTQINNFYNLILINEFYTCAMQNQSIQIQQLISMKLPTYLLIVKYQLMNDLDV